MADEEKNVDAARRRLSEAARGIEGRYREVAAGVRREAGRASELAREKYDAAAEGLKDGYGRLRRNAQSWSEDLEEYVRENPGRSVLIAGAAGFVLGLLFRGGRRD